MDIHTSPLSPQRNSTKNKLARLISLSPTFHYNMENVSTDPLTRIFIFFLSTKKNQNFLSTPNLNIFFCISIELKIKPVLMVFIRF